MIAQIATGEAVGDGDDALGQVVERVVGRVVELADVVVAGGQADAVGVSVDELQLRRCIPAAR